MFDGRWFSRWASLALVLCALAFPAGCKDRAPDVRKAMPAASAGAVQQAPVAQGPQAQHEAGGSADVQPHGLEYTEFVTGDAGPDDELPMVIAVHGLGDNAERYGKMFVNYATPYRVIVPQGPTAHGRSGFSWFDTNIEKGRVVYINTDEVKDSARRLAALADELSVARPTKSKPVITGFSQGGMLAYAVAVYHPDSVSMAIPVGGAIMPEILPGKRPENAPNPPIVALNGERDRLVQFVLAEKTIEHLQEMGYNARLSSYEKVEHRISFEMRTEMLELLTTQAK